MRSDMFKVIVERPRGRGSKDSSLRHRRRQFDEDSASRASMRAGIGRVFLNENLNPLKRYLLAQVGRPWNKVYGEIAANIDRRSTVQEHIYSHIHDFIAVQVQWREGALIDLRHPYPSFRSNEWLKQPLYVDPRTGLIRRNERFDSWRRRSRQHSEEKAADIARRRRAIGDGRWHLLLDGEWFEVTLAPLPQVEVVDVIVNGRVRRQRRAPWAFDVVLKQRLSRDDFTWDKRAKELYGSDTLHATRKRQLSKREIAKFDLPR